MPLSTTTTKTTPATLIDAVNILLRAIGQADVQSLDLNKMNQHAYAALGCLNEAAVTVQEQGWHFNTEEEYPAVPDVSGEISVPPEWVNVKLAPRSAGRYRVTVRDGKLYDKSKRTSVFTETIYLEFIKVYPFEDVPAAIRYYIVARAGAAFGPGRVPDSQTYRFSKEEESLALSAAHKADDEEAGNNLPETSPHFYQMRRR